MVVIGLLDAPDGLCGAGAGDEDESDVTLGVGGGMDLDVARAGMLPVTTTGSVVDAVETETLVVDGTELELGRPTPEIELDALYVVELV